MLENCNLCGFNCNVNRNNSLGVCKIGTTIKLGLVSKHFWEEPCISKNKGSGTIFFSGCNFKCIFCQNYKISNEYFGKEISIERLAKIFIEQQNRNVNNINLVSPTPYVPMIIEAIKIAKENGLNIPIVYNTNGFENVETIKSLNGLIDIYLPDIKYFDDEKSIRYSKVNNYFNVASKAIIEMYKQVGNPIFDENGIIKRGLIIRHLIMPNNIIQTKKILEWIKSSFPKDVYVSIMAQYFPTYKASEDDTINRKITKREYEVVLELIKDFENGYIQELSDCEEEYVPNFDLSNI